MADATPTGTTASSVLELPAAWLITGASSGLGRHLVERALTEGDHVIATVRREGTLDIPSKRTVRGSSSNALTSVMPMNWAGSRTES
jgi:NADP-dependent 3-hydroxy acid dehydrogenase YdfG